MNYKVLIVEDEKQIAAFIKMELEHAGCKAFVAENGMEALSIIEKEDFDVIVLDLMIPFVNGMEVCKRIRGFSTVPIIMLTAKNEIQDKVNGLDCGANDYMTKPFDIEELFARIRAVTRTSSPSKANALMAAGVVMQPDTHEVTCNGKPVQLTKKEFDLLEQLLLNAGIVMNRERLLDKVWDYDYFGDSNVVDVTIKHLRKKLEDKENKIISTVRGYGYVIRK